MKKMETDECMFQEIPITFNKDMEVFKNLKGFAQIFESSDIYTIQLNFQLPKEKASREVISEWLKLILNTQEGKDEN